MDRFSVAAVGVEEAALEGVLRLRKLAGDAVDITLVAPGDEYVVRALSVREPFALGAADRHPLRPLLRDAGAEWVRDRLAWVDLDGQAVHTTDGRAVGYDALLIAVGGQLAPAYEHATTYRDDRADELLRGTVEDVEEGYTKRIAFLAPDTPIWRLPLYELALMTANRAAEAGMTDVEVVLATPEPAPLAAFGEAASAAVAELLEDTGVTVHAGATIAVPEAGRVTIEPGGLDERFDRVIALPRMTGPAIRGLPGAGAHGFLPVDGECALRDGGGRVFAAGDATDLDLKHGGLGAQQADTAAAAIARLAGVDDVAPAPLHPVVHGKLLTGRRPLYLRARLVGGGSFESEVSEQPLGTEDKVVAAELGAYLAAHRG